MCIRCNFIEVFSRGMPVIAPVGGGIPEIVAAGSAGLLFAHDEVAGRAWSLGCVIQGLEALPRVRRAGLDTAQDVRPERIAEQYIDSDTDVLSAGKDGSSAP